MTAGFMDTILFYILASIAVVSAVAVITRSSALLSAVWLIICLLSVAGIFGLLNAPLIAVLQVLISAGAVMVLFVFVIMLVDLEKGLRARVIGFSKMLGAIAAGYMGFVLVIAIARPPYVEAPTSGESYEAPITLAKIMLGKYAVPFELAGVLLLVATVAVIALAKKPEAGSRKPEAGSPEGI